MNKFICLKGICVKLNAVEVWNKRLVIFEDSAQRLINKYIKK